MDKLPAELIESIADQINDEDIHSLHNLRRVCRVSERQTNKMFLKRCFGTRNIKRTNASINHLIEVMKLLEFGPLVQHLIVDADLGPDDQATSSKRREALMPFAGKTLESITFVHTAEPGPLAERVARNKCWSSPQTPSTPSLQRYNDVSAVVDGFIYIMDSLDIKTLRFSIPGAEDFEFAYAVGDWVLDPQHKCLSNLRQLDLHYFPTSIDTYNIIS